MQVAAGLGAALGLGARWASGARRTGGGRWASAVVGHWGGCRWATGAALLGRRERGGGGGKDGWAGGAGQARGYWGLFSISFSFFYLNLILDFEFTFNHVLRV
jgi:hypothetical protein